MGLQEIMYRQPLVSTGAAQTIDIPAGFDQFVLRNLTTLATGAGIVESKWWSGMASGTAETKTLGGGTITDAVITAGGFTYTDYPANLGPAIAIAGTSQAAGAVNLTATTPVVGQIVRVYGTTGMLQIAGMDFTVTAVNPGVSMTFGYLDSSGFAAPGTGGNYRLLPYDLPFYPRLRYVTSISQAAQAVIQMSVVHDFQAGEKVSFRCPAAFGMSEINGLTGNIVSISTVNNTITVDIDSSAFTAFAFPTSATAAAGVSFPQVVPAGELGTQLNGAIVNKATRSIFIGTNIAGTLGDSLEFWAYRSES